MKPRPAFSIIFIVLLYAIIPGSAFGEPDDKAAQQAKEILRGLDDWEGQSFNNFSHQ